MGVVNCEVVDYSCKTWKMNRQALDAPTQQELIGYLVHVGYTCTVKPLYKLTFESNFRIKLHLSKQP